jgi:hypothetical protein
MLDQSQYLHYRILLSYVDRVARLVEAHVAMDDPGAGSVQRPHIAFFRHGPIAGRPVGRGIQRHATVYFNQVFVTGIRQRHEKIQIAVNKQAQEANRKKLMVS